MSSQKNTENKPNPIINNHNVIGNASHNFAEFWKKHSKYIKG